MKEEQLLIKYYVIKHTLLLKYTKFDVYQGVLASTVYIHFGKKISGAINSGIILNRQLPEELYKPLITHLVKTIFGVLILMIYN